MKAHSFRHMIWLSIVVISSLFSCSDELNLNVKNSSLPVVYCIIDPGDSVYKVLLTKTFAGDKSVQELAQYPELISYRNAHITMEAWKNGYLLWNTDFEPIPTERDSGLFSSQPGCAFETRNVLSRYFGYGDDFKMDSIDNLRLIVDCLEGEEPATARIKTSQGRPQILYPVYNYKVFNLFDSIPYYIEFYTSDRLYYDLRFNIKYSELTDAWHDKSLSFSYRKNVPTQTGKFTQNIDPDKFFLRLAQNFSNTTDVIQRQLISIDLELFAGSPTLKTYMDIYYSDNENSYTLWNCFHNGIGLFATTAHASLSDLIMDQRTRDSLASGKYTKQLKFNRW